MSVVDILMITYNSPDYVRRSLPSLLDSCDDSSRVWLWHNGDDEATLAVAQEYSADARVHRFHHSPANVGLREPTNWLWANADGDYLSKVDDDCVLDDDWISRLRVAHESNVNFGVIGASRLRPDDIVPELVEAKLETFDGDVTLFRNHWLQGSGYLLKREWTERKGLLLEGQTWTNYCLSLAKSGAVNGFLYPFIFEDHMDDPRSEHTLLLNDDDLEWRMPLSAKRSKVRTLDDWESQLKHTAHQIQVAPTDLRHFQGWRLRVGHLRSRVNRYRSVK